MNIQQLFKQTKFETIWSRYSELYNTNEGEREFLEEVYRELLSKEVETNNDNYTVELTYCKDDLFDEGDEWFGASIRQENDNQRCSLSFIDWSEVIGYNFDLNSYDEVTFLAVLMYELTFYGDEVDMVEEREELIETANGIKNGSIKATTFKSLEEFFSQLESEDE